LFVATDCGKKGEKMKIVNELPMQLLVLKKDKGEFDSKKIEFNLKPFWNNKPSMAIWTSSQIKKGSSAWTQWCSREMPDWIEGVRKYLIKPNNGVKVLEISSKEDLEGVPQINHLLNFWKIKKMGISAVHLTTEGARELHWGSFNSWDIESTVWLTVEFRVLKEIS
jgi:hypothetical protein